MSKVNGKSEDEGRGTFDLTHRHSHGQADLGMQRIHSIDEAIKSLKTEGSRLDTINEAGNIYEVATNITVDRKEWHFYSSVRLNGQEITDDIRLIKDERCRKRVTQANKTKALWNLFIKEAAETHVDKYDEVKGRFTQSGKNRWPIGMKLSLVFGLAIIAAGGIWVYLLYLSPPELKQMASSPLQTESPPPPMPMPITLTLDQLKPLPPPAPAVLAPHKAESSPSDTAAAPTTSYAKESLPQATSDVLAPLQPESSPSGMAPAPILDQAETVPRAAPAMASPLESEAPPPPSRKSSDLSPIELREKVSNLLKKDSASQ